MKVEKENERIDKYLASVLDISRENIIKMLNEGYILVNNKKVKPSYKTKLNDEVIIKSGFFKETKLKETNIPLDIVYEDEYLMVINKPSGLVVHPGAGNKENTLVNALLYYTHNLSKMNDLRPGIVHRLDKDTSGLMLVAKCDKAHEILAEDFKNKRIHREYIALLYGNFPTDSATIDAPIARDKFHFEKMCVAKDGKRAVTHLKVIKRYKEYTLVNLVLETGRTHQIRVHLSYINYPVFNDPVYQNKPTTDFGQFLHSSFISFTHPITHEHLEFFCPLPKEFQEFLEKLE